MKIAIVGTGYQGLVVGTCLAETGHQVTCLEADPERLSALQAGTLPFHEPGLEELLVRNLEEERLTFSSNVAQVIDDCLSILFCVNPPVDEEGKVDTRELLSAFCQQRSLSTRYCCRTGICVSGEHRSAL